MTGRLAGALVCYGHSGQTQHRCNGLEQPHSGTLYTLGKCSTGLIALLRPKPNRWQPSSKMS